MSFTLRLATEADAGAITDIVLGIRSPLQDALYPQGYSSTLKAESDADYRKDTTDPKVLMVLAVKQFSPQDVVGFAKWRISREPEQAAVPARTHRRHPSINTQLKNDFKLELYKHQQTHTDGKAHIRLSNLFTNPDYQKQGVGTKLLEYGLALADEIGVFTYLEASPAAVSLYTKLGFAEVGSFTVDLSKYKPGAQQDYTTTLMIRPASGSHEQCCV